MSNSRALIEDGDDLSQASIVVTRRDSNMWTCTWQIIQGWKTCKCYLGKSNCMLILVILHLNFRSFSCRTSAIHWGSPNSYSISCYNSSLPECSPPITRTDSSPCWDMSDSRALIEDADDLGQTFIVVTRSDSNTWTCKCQIILG
jgi:hypothetical protein